VLGNHDRPRIAAKVGEPQARVAAMLLLTLRGTPTLYYGDELGIGRVDIPPAQVQDPRELREPGLGLGRDPVRTPMQWDADGSFTEAEHPWLPFAPDQATVNVAAQQDDPGSLLQLYRRLLAARRHIADAPYRTLSVHDNVQTNARGDDVTVTIDFDTGATELRTASSRLPS
jgi:glycosidase